VIRLFDGGGLEENPFEHIACKVPDLLGREMVLPHHLFDSPGARGEPEHGRNPLLEFKGQLVLFPSA